MTNDYIPRTTSYEQRTTNYKTLRAVLRFQQEHTTNDKQRASSEHRLRMNNYDHDYYHYI